MAQQKLSLLTQATNKVGNIYDYGVSHPEEAGLLLIATAAAAYAGYHIKRHMKRQEKKIGNYKIIFYPNLFGASADLVVFDKYGHEVDSFRGENIHTMRIMYDHLKIPRHVKQLLLQISKHDRRISKKEMAEERREEKMEHEEAEREAKRKGFDIEYDWRTGKPIVHAKW